MKDRAAITKELAEDAYERLANAIIVNAANDYRVVLKKCKNNPYNEDAIQERKKLENFFLSAWYKALTKVDGTYLMTLLRQEADM